MPNTVWVLTSMEPHANETLCGVYSTHALAEAAIPYAEIHPGNKPEIYEVEIDALPRLRFCGEAYDRIG